MPVAENQIFLEQITEEVKQRFWGRVVKSDGCWEWKPPYHNQGYGIIMVGLVNRKAHRISWMIANNRTIPKGMYILHSCDNRCGAKPGESKTHCVRPDHLFLGTQKDNMQDASKKKRMNPMSILTEGLVLKMRTEPRTLSYKKIAEKYGVSTMTAFRAITKQCWGHI